MTPVVPLGSIVRPTWINFFFINFLMFTSIVSTHNFADDNNSNNLTINVDCLKLIFESECKVAIKWFHKNKLIINPAIQAIKYLISVNQHWW